MNRRLIMASFAGLLWSPAAAQTIEIHGIRLGDQLQAVSTRLDPLGQRGGTATKDGGRKEAWILKEGDYTSVAVKANAKGEIVWVSGFLRTGKEIPFSKLGDLTKATHTEYEAIWNMEDPAGSYRLVTKGSKHLARVVYLMRLPAMRGR